MRFKLRRSAVKTGSSAFLGAANEVFQPASEKILRGLSAGSRELGSAASRRLGARSKKRYDEVRGAAIPGDASSKRVELLAASPKLQSPASCSRSRRPDCSGQTRCGHAALTRPATQHNSPIRCAGPSTAANVSGSRAIGRRNGIGRCPGATQSSEYA
jgi:hypothetical protein